MSEEILKIVNEYKNELEKINEKLKHFPYEVIFNNQLLNPSDSIKGIIVMDNPGDEEKEQGAYLVGQAGKQFNNVLQTIGVERKDVLVFNKSAITTHGTNDLCSIYKDEALKEIFLEEQQITFNTIQKISNLLGIPVMIHGYAAYLKNGKRFVENEKGNRPLYLFFKNLIENQEQMQKYTHFYKHSSYGNLSKQIMKHSETLGVEKLTFEQYLELGKENCKGFFD